MSVSDDDDIPAVVIDNGSGMLKAGFAFDDFPRTSLSSVIGRPHNVVSIHPANILLKSVLDRYRPDRNAVGPITIRYKFEQNANWLQAAMNE